MRDISPSCRSRPSSSPATSPSSRCARCCRLCSASLSRAGRQSCSSSLSSRPGGSRSRAALCARLRCSEQCCARLPRPRWIGTLRRSASPTRVCRARRGIVSSSCTSSTRRIRRCPLSWTPGSRMPSVKRATVVTHGRPETVAAALARVEQLAAKDGVELTDVDDVDLAIVLGGDGTMLRALTRFLDTGVPVLGVNFGRVGFLTTISAAELEPGLARAFAGDYRTDELPTLDVRLDGEAHTAVNDAVVAGGTLGRMTELEWAIGDEVLGVQPCDGLICATPPGSTAYN